MLDLEQTLKELDSFVRRLTDDKQKNIQDIQLNVKKYVKKLTKYENRSVTRDIDRKHK